MGVFIKRVLYSIGIFCILFVLLIFIAGFLTRGSRLNAFDLKEYRADRLKGQKKILVVGGSAADYGINSEQIESSIGIPVVNLALQGSLGLSFMLNEAKALAERNDIVLLHLESELFSKIPVEGESTLIQLISRAPRSKQYVSRVDFKNLPVYLSETLRTNISGVFLSVAYILTGKKSNTELRNAQGDYVGHQGKRVQYVSQKETECFFVNDDAIKILETFVKDCVSRNVTVLFAFAPIDKETILMNCADRLQQNIIGISGLKVIGPYEQAQLPSSYFFDTSHHLKFEWRDFWTGLVITGMKREI